MTLAAENLIRGFGSGALRTLALRDVSLSLNAGEVTLLIGPSGSGKSTLLACLSGLLQPEGGHVQALGYDLWQLSSRKREAFRRKHCGFVFQGYNLFSALSARQQLEVVLRWGSRLGMRTAAGTAGRMLKELDMAGKGHLRPHQLSGGEKQRVAVARALVKQPSLVFADEPTAALDWEHGKQVIDLLTSAAHRDGATVLVVAHDPRMIPLADRVLHLVDGRLSNADPLAG